MHYLGTQAKYEAGDRAPLHAEVLANRRWKVREYNSGPRTFKADPMPKDEVLLEWEKWHHALRCVLRGLSAYYLGQLRLERISTPISPAGTAAIAISHTTFACSLNAPLHRRDESTLPTCSPGWIEESGH